MLTNRKAAFAATYGGVAIAGDGMVDCDNGFRDSGPGRIDAYNFKWCRHYRAIAKSPSEEKRQNIRRGSR
jgi:hypothetical protein